MKVIDIFCVHQTAIRVNAFEDHAPASTATAIAFSRALTAS